MNLLLSRFAAMSPSPQNHWPYGPFLDLPAGRVYLDGGHLAWNDRWVLACGLSPRHWLVAHRLPGKRKSDALLEQFIGFLTGRDVAVVTISLRCERDWFQVPGTGDLDVRRCVVCWLRSFFAKDAHLQRLLPGNIWPITPLATDLQSGQLYWRDAALVLTGVEAHDSDLLYDLAPLITSRARGWENYLARLLRQANLHDEVSRADHELVRRLDRCFYQVVTRFLPAYELLPTTTARLL